MTEPSTMEMALAFIIGEAFGSWVFSIVDNLVAPLVLTIPGLTMCCWKWASGHGYIMLKHGASWNGELYPSAELAEQDGALVVDYQKLWGDTLAFFITMTATYWVFSILEKAAIHKLEARASAADAGDGGDAAEEADAGLDEASEMPQRTNVSATDFVETSESHQLYAARKRASIAALLDRHSGTAARARGSAASVQRRASFQMGKQTVSANLPARHAAPRPTRQLRPGSRLFEGEPLSAANPPSSVILLRTAMGGLYVREMTGGNLPASISTAYASLLISAAQNGEQGVSPPPSPPNDVNEIPFETQGLASVEGCEMSGAVGSEERRQRRPHSKPPPHQDAVQTAVLLAELVGHGFNVVSQSTLPCDSSGTGVPLGFELMYTLVKQDSHGHSGRDGERECWL